MVGSEVVPSLCGCCVPALHRLHDLHGDSELRVDLPVRWLRRGSFADLQGLVAASGPVAMIPSGPSAVGSRHARVPRVSGAVCLAGVPRRVLPTPVPPLPPSAGRLQPSTLLLDRRSARTWLSNATPNRIEIPSTHRVPGSSSTPDFVAARGLARATRILNLLGGALSVPANTIWELPTFRSQLTTNL
jgi:hypothetical protein